MWRLVLFLMLMSSPKAFRDKGLEAQFEVAFTISGVDTQNPGKVVLAIYDEKDFLKKMIYMEALHPSTSEVKTSVSLSEGTYCFSVYQDTNQNNKLDRNFIGIPKEPIAFSKNYKPFGPPKFKGCAVLVNKKMSVTLKMEKVL